MFYSSRSPIFFTLSLSLLLATASAAQSQKSPEADLLPAPTLTREALRFEQLSLRDGLSQSSVFDIMQDTRGFMWFATQEGLNRYDGRQFTVYKSQPFDSNSLSSSWIWSISEASDGTIWAGTQRGVNRVDPLTGAVTRYVHDPLDSTSLSGNNVFRVLSDSKGIVWAGTWGGGLNRIDPVSGAIQHYRNDPDDEQSLSNNMVLGIYEDSRGSIWAGTGMGLSRLDAETGTFTRFFYPSQIAPSPDRIASHTVIDIREDPRDVDVLWLATGSGFVRLHVPSGEYESFIPENADEDLVHLEFDPNMPEVLWATTDGGGLARFDTRTKNHTVFRHDPLDPTGVNHDALFGIHADRSGMMWVGAQSQTGVSKFDPSAGAFTNYRHRPGDRSSLFAGLVWRVYVPPSNPDEIWSVHQDGAQRSKDRLNRIDQVTGKVEDYAHDPRNPRSIGAGVITDIHEDRLGQLWVATTGGGLNLFDRKNQSFRRFLPKSSDPTSISSSVISGIYEDREGILWIGTTGGGLNRMDPRQPGRFERFMHDPSDATTLSGTNVSQEGIGEDGTGDLWVGTNNGLSRFDRSRKQFVRYRSDSAASSLAANNVARVYTDLSGAVWAVTTENRGHVLHRYEPESDSFTRFEHNPSDPNSLSDTRVEVIHERPQEPGMLWIGSPSGGLTRLDPSSGTLRHYTEAQGLANNFVYGILSDDDGHLWLSTNNGLSRFNPETEQFRNFNEEDGLQSREFNSHAFFRSVTGRMVFGSIGGVTSFDPAALRPNLVPPQVALTDFRLFNKSVVPGPGSVLPEPLARMKEIRLAHWQKTLSLDFVALHFKNPAGNQYAYMLDGFDSDWVEAGSQRTATYTNLDPGRYVFRVRAANSDGVWNEEGAAIAIFIAPPVWQTWWFRILALLAVIGLAVTFYRARVRQIQSRNRELETQVAERTSELRRKKEQLEKSHAIIEAINAETNFQALLTAVLEQTKVIPGVEKASALVYDESLDAFVFKASLGWDLLQIGPIQMTPEEAHARYVEHAEQVAEDVYLEREVGARPGGELFGDLGTPASLLVVRIRSGGHVDGYLVFDNMHNRDAFDQQDLDLLTSLREHIRSAFVKTRLLENVRRSLENLTTTQAQLVQSEKLASLGQLTAGIAHEIKNPLNFINNFAGLCAELADEIEEEIRSRGVSDEAIETILGDLRLNAAKIQEHGHRADGIVKSMLQHSRGKAGERQDVDLNALLDEYVNLAFHGMKAQQTDFNVAIDRSFDSSVGKMNVIPQEIGRVFINLLNNAFYAVHEKASVENGQYVPRVTVETRRHGGDVELRISDNGPGIPDRIKARIFEPFFTTKPTGEGTGLGLSLSYEIITKGHNGSLHVESADGGGTGFRIVLPGADVGRNEAVERASA